MINLIDTLTYLFHAFYNKSYFRRHKINRQKEVIILNSLKIPSRVCGIKKRLHEPLNFIIFAKDDKTFQAFLKKTGWFDAEPVTFTGSIRGTFWNLFNLPYDRFQLTPYFWNGKIQDYNIQKPTQKKTVRERHHARFWKTNLKNKLGQKIYVGTASFDNGMAKIFSHTIDPNIDKEREYLFSEFKKTSMIRNYKKIKFSDKIDSKIFNGDRFFSDGFGYLIYLK